MKSRRSDGRQVLVDRIFRECLAADRRTLNEIRSRIRSAARMPGMSLWLTTWAEDVADHELQIMVSRNCMGEGEWEYFPAYSNPPRYVSRARVRQLCGLAEQHRLTPALLEELRQQLADLRAGVAHWRAKHARARQKERELSVLIEDITTRAFAGHHDLLL